MMGYGPTTFGDLNAEKYDAHHNPGTTDAGMDLSTDLASIGRLAPGRTLGGRQKQPLTAASEKPIIAYEKPAPAA